MKPLEQINVTHTKKSKKLDFRPNLLRFFVEFFIEFDKATLNERVGDAWATKKKTLSVRLSNLIGIPIMG